MRQRVVGFEPDGLLLFEHGLLRLPGIQVGARQAEPDDGIVRHQRGDLFDSAIRFGSTMNYLYLKQVAKNQFEVPALRIEFAPDQPKTETIGLLAVKVWFNEVTNQADSDLYENRDDRYALLSWFTPEVIKDNSYGRSAQRRCSVWASRT